MFRYLFKHRRESDENVLRKFHSTFCQFLPFFMEKTFDIKEIFDCAE